MENELIKESYILHGYNKRNFERTAKQNIELYLNNEIDDCFESLSKDYQEPLIQIAVLHDKTVSVYLSYYSYAVIEKKFDSLYIALILMTNIPSEDLNYVGTMQDKYNFEPIRS